MKFCDQRRVHYKQKTLSINHIFATCFSVVLSNGKLMQKAKVSLVGLRALVEATVKGNTLNSAVNGYGCIRVLNTGMDPLTIFALRLETILLSLSNGRISQQCITLLVVRARTSLVARPKVVIIVITIVMLCNNSSYNNKNSRTSFIPLTL